MKMTRFGLAVATLLASAGPVFSQLPPGGEMAQMLSKLLRENKDFSAKLEIALEPEGNGKMVLKGVWAALDGNLRTEMDVTEVMPERARDLLDQMKMMGLDNSYQVMRTDKKLLYLVYPTLKSYVEMPMPQAWAAAADNPPNLKLTDLGEETVDGHPCVKTKVVLTFKEGASEEFTVWKATDLGEFPIKMETKRGTTRIISKFTDVKLGKPAAAAFEPPAGFTRYDNMNQLIHAALRILMPPEPNP